MHGHFCCEGPHSRVIHGHSTAGVVTPILKVGPHMATAQPIIAVIDNGYTQKVWLFADSSSEYGDTCSFSHHMVDVLCQITMHINCALSKLCRSDQVLLKHDLPENADKKSAVPGWQTEGCSTFATGQHSSP